MDACASWEQNLGGVSAEACQLRKGCTFSVTTGKCATDDVDCSRFDDLSDKELVAVMSVLRFNSEQCNALIGRRFNAFAQIAQQLSKMSASWQNRKTDFGRTFREDLCDCVMRTYPQLGKQGVVLLVYAIRNVLVKFFDREFLAWLRACQYVHRIITKRITYKKRLMLEFLVSREQFNTDEELIVASKQSIGELEKAYFSTDARKQSLAHFESKTKSNPVDKLHDGLMVLHGILKGAKTISILDFIRFVHDKAPQLYEAAQHKDSQTAILQTARVFSMPSRAKLATSYQSLVGLVTSSFQGESLASVSLKSTRGLAKELVACVSAFLVFKDIVDEIRNGYGILLANKRLRETTVLRMDDLSGVTFS
uniref:Uncharacterized protein n=1 Tax=viral metagenome TaxID=1070528 RepID=A0A6C0KFC9_9ZZZZ